MHKSWESRAEHRALRNCISFSFLWPNAYLLLYEALNGLRDASLHWLNLLSNSIRGVGLTSDKVEP